MKLIRESISFERGKDPKEALDIGETNIYAKTKLFDELEKTGIGINLGWSHTGKEKERVIERIHEFIKLIDKLLNAGLNYRDMEISHYDSINIKVIQILVGNRVIHQCISKKDANILVTIIKKFTVDGNDRNDISLSIGEKFLYLDRDQTWLDNIIENREKYKNIK
jgi:hypothetical protein